MKSGPIIVLVGTFMVVLGAIFFYSMSNYEIEEIRSIRHGGTFLGLMGIGVIIAGGLLFLINRNEVVKQ